MCFLSMERACRIAQGMVRDVKGALVLGQKQECYAGCFAPELALDGEMAELRIWNKVRSAEDIQATMHKSVRCFAICFHVPSSENRS